MAKHALISLLTAAIACPERAHAILLVHQLVLHGPREATGRLVVPLLAAEEEVLAQGAAGVAADVGALHLLQTRWDAAEAAGRGDLLHLPGGIDVGLGGVDAGHRHVTGFFPPLVAAAAGIVSLERTLLDPVTGLTAFVTDVAVGRCRFLSLHGESCHRSLCVGNERGSEEMIEWCWSRSTYRRKNSISYVRTRSYVAQNRHVIWNPLKYGTAE